MINVDEAKRLIREQVKALAAVETPLPAAAGLVLAADVYAGIDIPAFAQSSMDGYAFAFAGWKTHTTLQIAGEIPAGQGELASALPHQAMRIFTGAAVPAGTDTIVMQEKVRVTNDVLIIEDKNLAMGTNVRSRGAEIKAGELALQSGTILSPAAIGFLTGIGTTHVNVYPKPTVGIIATGRELQQPGTPLQHGQVYESNSEMLVAALNQLQVNTVKKYWADDKLDELQQILESVIMESDMVLLTGGVSVGDYDFVLEAATRCGVTQIFHRIKQRPGKPLFFGKKNDTVLFGLPGNPSSVLTCFYEYVLPALQQLSNTRSDGLKKLLVPLAKDIEKPGPLTVFLKGLYDGEKAIPLDAQESYRLSSFAKANCLIRIDEDITRCNKDEIVEIHLLPDN